MDNIDDKYIQRSDKDLKKLTETLAQGSLSGTAEIIRHYNNHLSKTFSSPYAIAVSSGSAAIQAALHVLRVEYGSEVLVPAIAPLPSVFPVSALGAIPIPVDTRPDSTDYDPDDLKSKITLKTRAAIIVPLWGYPIELTETLDILHKKGIPLIEDAAHAHGASWNGKMVGTHGTFGCFSTHDRKLLATGEGGFILTSKYSLAKKVHSHCYLGNLEGNELGVNFKLNAFAATIGLVRLEDLQQQIKVRIKNANKLKENIGLNASLQELILPLKCEPNYYNLCLLLRNISEIKARMILQEIYAQGIFQLIRLSIAMMFFTDARFTTIYKRSAPMQKVL